MNLRLWVHYLYKKLYSQLQVVSISESESIKLMTLKTSCKLIIAKVETYLKSKT